MNESDLILKYFDKTQREGMKLSEVVDSIADASGKDRKLIERILILEREPEVEKLMESEKLIEKTMSEYTDDEWDDLSEAEQDRIRGESKKDKGSNSNIGPGHNKFEESMTASGSGIDAATPENVLEKLEEDREHLENTEVVYGDDVRNVKLEEKTMSEYSDDEWDNLSEAEQEKIRKESKKPKGDNSNIGPGHNRLEERIRERKQRNRLLRESLGLPEEEEELSPVRYQLQKFTNGGQEYDPETNEVKFSETDEPSVYEQWRRERLDKARSARIEDAKAPRSYHSTYERAMDQKGALDDQVDDFLAEYIKKYGELS
jgi:hypothetical protein